MRSFGKLRALPSIKGGLRPSAGLLAVSAGRHGAWQLLGARTSLAASWRSGFSTESKGKDSFDVPMPSAAATEATGVPDTPIINKEEPSIPTTPPVPKVDLDEKETISGPAETKGFETETLKLLNIVTHSLYSDKEVFVRELVSNASDALEKRRQLAVASSDDTISGEIVIIADDDSRKLVIQDFGVGMSKDELIENLGTIAHSGTVEYLKQLEDGASGANIIGQFGVGFYSIFMVADKVTVFSKSCKDPKAKGYSWTSDGSGKYDIAEAKNVEIGTKIVLELKDNAAEFSKQQNIETILKKYSNFVGFPIMLNGVRVNTVRALWMEDAKTITPEEHMEFYQYISRAHDEPLFNLSFNSDTPLALRSLFYVGESHMEKYGMGKMDPGLSLFSRKVLIMPKAKGLLPDWLRFVKGVVDSEDVPLSISREHLQDQAIIRRLQTVLTRRLLKFFLEMSRKDKDKYEKKFWPEYQNFFKEGACSDMKWKDEIAKLIRLASSAVGAGEVTSLEAYVERMPEGQDTIYFLNGPSRAICEASPYYEGFKRKGTEVLFLYEPIDDFMMTNLSAFAGKKMLSIEKSNPTDDVAKETPAEAAANTEFLQWIKEALASKISDAKLTTRLVDTPAIIVDHETASYRRMMKFVDPDRAPQLPKQALEINASHPLMKKLNDLRKSSAGSGKAKIVAEQIYDNALIAAGLMEDSRGMLPRLNSLLELAMSEEKEADIVEEAVEGEKV